LRLLLDTHIWVWSVSQQERLSRRVRAAVTRASNELWISPISAWEFMVLAEVGRLKVRDDPRRWLATAMAATPAREAPLTVEIAIRSREILRGHPDPADRLLVATALVHDLTLVTADEALIEAKPCPILAN
jgi:PIN domain nuclease of toxin-antitoxin system